MEKYPISEELKNKLQVFSSLTEVSKGQLNELLNAVHKEKALLDIAQQQENNKLRMRK